MRPKHETLVFGIGTVALLVILYMYVQAPQSKQSARPPILSRPAKIPHPHRSAKKPSITKKSQAKNNTTPTPQSPLHSTKVQSPFTKPNKQPQPKKNTTTAPEKTLHSTKLQSSFTKPKVKRTPSVHSSAPPPKRLIELLFCPL